MRIKTDTPLVKRAREGVMEFLLINHPLDCPICDQGGECDLQDQAMAFGSDRSRFTETKRAVNDKNLGPLVKTVMTRCIHCTRCVRFASEVAGVPELGVTGRGNASEIGTYVEKLLTSELSGNVIDLCPVGALTSKPYAFTSRPWELRPTESVDVSDALGCNIRIDSRGSEVMRVVPRLNESVNEEWVSDRARFQYDALRRQRLDVPMRRPAPGAPLEPCTWAEALEAVRLGLAKAAPNGGDAVSAIAGRLADAESIVALKDLANRLGSGNTRHEDATHHSDGGDVSADSRAGYVSGSTILGVEKADLALLVGCNPRQEAAVYNARLRKAWLDGLRVGVVLGERPDLTYTYDYLGGDLAALKAIASGGGGAFGDALRAAKRPLIVVGSGLLSRPDRDAALRAVHDAVASLGNVVTPEWNGFNLLHTSASRVAALDLGFVPSASARASANAATPTPPKFVYLLGADDWHPSAVPDSAFVVYQGHHGDKGAARADVVLPGAAYTEKDGTYCNTEGRPQRGRSAVPPPGQARDDWAVLRAVSEVVGQPLPYDTLDGVRARLTEVAPHLARTSEVSAPIWLGGDKAAKAGLGEGAGAKPLEASAPLTSPVSNFYMTDAISRASQTMAKCVLARQDAQRQAAARA
jgi:NADH dehydrogenase (ubiquinone) Fe-S protein 1